MFLSGRSTSNTGNLDTIIGISTTPLVTAIIPAYNEASNIGIVLDVLCQVSILTEIIVVDDGSKDGTVEVVRSKRNLDPRIRLLIHPKNCGKGEAIFTGWRASQANTLLMLDADLINLRPEHVEALIEPVVKRQTNMTLGLFKGGRWATDFSHWLTPWLTGQRCFRAELLRYVSQQAATGYGLETALTIAARQKGWQSLAVPMAGASHLPSEAHRGLLKGFYTRSKMYSQIFLAWYRISIWERFVSRIRIGARQG
jgi:GT2 family glycosyltransferase